MAPTNVKKKWRQPRQHALQWTLGDFNFRYNWSFKL